MPASDWMRDPEAFDSSVAAAGIPVQPVLTSLPHLWAGLFAVRAILPPAVPDLIAVPDTISSSANFLTLQLRGTYRLRCQCAGQVSAGWLTPGAILLVPRGAPNAWSWSVADAASGSALDAAMIYLDDPLMTALAAEVGRTDPARVDLRYCFNFRDPLIEQIGLALMAELQCGGLGGRLYAETLGRALGLHLLRTQSSLVAQRAPAGRGLTQRQLRWALDYIHSQLHHSFGLGELAAAVGLSPWYFARQFKASTGLAPHQYVLQCRVERARDLLLEGTLTVAEVAQRAGFADQSQLVRHTKRLLGVLPRDIAARARIARN